jgi:hypothetical protein
VEPFSVYAEPLEISLDHASGSIPRQPPDSGGLPSKETSDAENVGARSSRVETGAFGVKPASNNDIQSDQANAQNAMGRR